MVRNSKQASEAALVITTNCNSVFANTSNDSVKSTVDGKGRCQVGLTWTSEGLEVVVPPEVDSTQGIPSLLGLLRRHLALPNSGEGFKARLAS